MPDDMYFVIIYLKPKKGFRQKPKENIIWTGPGLYTDINMDRLANNDK